MAKIIADTARCASSGMCALTAPDHFDQDDQDGRVVVLNPDDDADEVAEAVRLCPTGALRLEP